MMKPPDTSKKQLVEYGLGHSRYILANAKRLGVTPAIAARGIAYTTKDDQFPPTRLDMKENPFIADVLTAASVLDLGCGVGRNLPWIMEHTHAQYVGLDPNPVMLDSFWDINDSKWKPRVRLLKNFSTSTPTFDVVVCTFVFQHLGYRAPEGVMNVTDITQEVMRYTRPGTVWILLEHDGEESWIERWIAENGIIPDVFMKKYKGLPELTHRDESTQCGGHHLIIWKQP